MSRPKTIMTKIGFGTGRPKRAPHILTPEERTEIHKMYLDWLKSSPNAVLLGESPFLRVYGLLYFEKLAAENKRFAEQLQQLKDFGASIGGKDDA